MPDGLTEDEQLQFKELLKKSSAVFSCHEVDYGHNSTVHACCIGEKEGWDFKILRL